MAFVAIPQAFGHLVGRRLGFDFLRKQICILRLKRFQRPLRNRKLRSGIAQAGQRVEQGAAVAHVFGDDIKAVGA